MKGRLESRDGASTQLPRRAADQLRDDTIAQLARRAAVKTATERCLETRGDGGKPRVERRR